MPLHCNIDAKGKAVRLALGSIVLLVGALLAIFWAWPSGWWVAWAVSLLSIVNGAFVIFESRAGWCVIRAMGFKTPI